MTKATTIDHAALERIETAAFADLYRAAPPAFQRAYAVDVQRVADAWCFRCRDFNPTLLFRRVAGIGIERPAAPDELDAIAAHMQALDQPYSVQLSPHARPAALVGWLESRGFTRGYAWMKFARACTPPPEAPTDLDIRVVGAEHADPFGRIVAEGFGFPSGIAPWLGALPGREGWICMLAFAGGVPAGAGAAYVDGAYAWLGFAATLSDFRRRGAQHALLAGRMQEAAARGARTAVVETGERVPGKPSNSYRNILRAGFEEIYLRSNYLSPVPD